MEPQGRSGGIGHQCFVVGGEGVVAEHGQEVGHGEDHGEESCGPKADLDLVSLAVADEVAQASLMLLLAAAALGISAVGGVGHYGCLVPAVYK